MLEKITIIGMGVMGASLARIVQKNGIANKIIGADSDPEVCEQVKRLGIADAAMTDIKQAVVGSALVVICAPVGVYHEIGLEIGPTLKPGAIVTDVGSVKNSVIPALKSHLPESVHFVPAHPIAGSERSGPEAGIAELFEGQWCVLTPFPDSDIQAVEIVSRFWEECGARIDIQEPEQHDLMVAMISHMPQLLSYVVSNMTDDLEQETKLDIMKFAGEGYQDLTRIAASNPVIWRDIFLNNKEHMVKLLEELIDQLTTMQQAIDNGDGVHLIENFLKAQNITHKARALAGAGAQESAVSETGQGLSLSAAGLRTKSDRVA